jgi:hypothetical protein
MMVTVSDDAPKPVLRTRNCFALTRPSIGDGSIKEKYKTYFHVQLSMHYDLYIQIPLSLSRLPQRLASPRCDLQIFRSSDPQTSDFSLAVPGRLGIRIMSRAIAVHRQINGGLV